MISIIIPIYNAEKYISRCISSILDSSYKNFEIICVNDGSTDNTIELLNEFSKKDNRVKVYTKKNGGSASARNYGLNLVNGDYLAFIDADDYVHKDYFKILYNTAKKYNTDIVECDYYLVSDGIFAESNQVNDYNVKIISNIKKLEEFCGKKEYLKSSVLWTKIYSKKLFDNIKFIENKGIDDEFIIHELIYKANNIALVDKKLYYYYMSPNSQMRSNPKLNKIDNTEAIENQMNFFEKKGLRELKERLYYRYYRTIINNIVYLK